MTSGKPLEQSLLNTGCAYLVDTGADWWVWIGKKAPFLLRTAARRLVYDIRDLFPRQASRFGFIRCPLLESHS